MNPLKDSENQHVIHAQLKHKLYGIDSDDAKEDCGWRPDSCDCLKTSEKLRRVLKTFPSPPPPMEAREPTPHVPSRHARDLLKCISANCAHTAPHSFILQPMSFKLHKNSKDADPLAHRKSLTHSHEKRLPSQSPTSVFWFCVAELVCLLQKTVTVTAVGIYYVVYCYMQFVYYTLQSALYFHNADRQMKVTLAVVTVTSLVVACNLLIRLERYMGFELYPAPITTEHLFPEPAEYTELKKCWMDNYQ